MKCIYLAAGYATRLYPLTENFPKPLLEVAGKSILDWLYDDLESGGSIDRHVIVTNHRYVPHFNKWATRHDSEKIVVIDDGTMDNANRLGAVRDITLVLEQDGLDDEVLVVAGDNLLDFSLWQLIEYGREMGTSCVMRYWEDNKARLRKSGVLTLNDNELVTGMVEKPSEPASHWCCPPFYYFKYVDASRFNEGLAAGCGTDAPGSYLAWLCGVSTIHAMQMPGQRHDIGDAESYARAQSDFLVSRTLKQQTTQ